MTTHFDFSEQALRELAHADVVRAVAEDVGTGDLTAALIDPARQAQAPFGDHGTQHFAGPAIDRRRGGVAIAHFDNAEPFLATAKGRSASSSAAAPLAFASSTMPFQ
mgnify:CR=1 FL=1